MDCNKEEAIRAKGIADKMMERKDFVGARKLVLKAQQLCPDLENISQMIMVCDVHCSAESKCYGNEKDWYGILKVEPTADHALIRKQYRKFALLLHPDKNKFAGATDAFKLIFEAQKALLDHEKRRLYDSKIRTLGKCETQNGVAQQSVRHSNASKHAWVQNNSNNFWSKFMNQQHQQPQQTAQFGFPNRPTFWTACPLCGIRYQFYKDVVNKLLFCQNCKHNFTGLEINPPSATAGINFCQPVYFQRKERRNGTAEVKLQSPFNDSTSEMRVQRSVYSEKPVRDSLPKTEFTSGTGGESKPKSDKENNGEARSYEFKQHRKTNDKRRGKIEESSQSCNTGTRYNSDEDIIIEEALGRSDGQKSGDDSVNFPRRSSRFKKQVSYNETLNDDVDELMNPSKRARSSGLSSISQQEVRDELSREKACNVSKPAGLAADMEKDEEEVKQKENYSNGERLQNRTKNAEVAREIGTEADAKTSEVSESMSNSSPDSVREPEIFEYLDPDFSDFDNDRKKDVFAVGQIWACYDPLDAMPRFYARISKVVPPGFRVRVTWLEPDPDDEEEVKWVDEGLPVACGKFRQGDSHDTEDHPMFSHLISWEKGKKRDTYMIFPRRGETWAMFKNWDIKWYSDPDGKRKFEFEFVEVLSDYADGVGIWVAYLSKIRSFACLFCQRTGDGIDSDLIPPKEMFRFSHKVPSFRMTGKERKDVPKGSLELDPASLPPHLEEIAFPGSLKMENAKVHANGSCLTSSGDMVEPLAESEGKVCTSQINSSTHSDSNSINSGYFMKDHCPAPVPAEACLVPESEFYDFDADKLPERFQAGQFWALYSDEDGLPKYYGQIKAVDYHPEFRVHLMWLAACLPPNGMIGWFDKKMPICCGMFKPRKGKAQIYTETASFSHKLIVELTDRNDVYAIFPRKGEVWALYKNWSAGMTLSDLKSCEYDVVEVLKENDPSISVLFLEQVDGFKSVFKAKKKGQSTLTMNIYRTDLLLRFSHQIPSFRLTEERGGNLRGFWELDLAAMPCPN